MNLKSNKLCKSVTAEQLDPYIKFQDTPLKTAQTHILFENTSIHLTNGH